ncbi:MAG: bifunctional serine/threonine-protein kinase/formylglycine-generating enzyme family protein [Acidobacteriota bacterium]
MKSAPLPSRYENLEELGQGGQGVVYRVFDHVLSREAALKTLPRRLDSQQAREFFVREARLAARLQHPSIIPIHDLGELPDGRPYYTMLLVKGRSLLDVLEARDEQGERNWSTTRLIQALLSVAQALRVAHDENVLHRDIKPGNILLGKSGEVWLVDWGIAKDVLADDPMTSTGVTKGTPAYIAPEVLIGKPATVRSDLYSLGVVLYAILTSNLPFHADNAAELIASVLRDPVPPLECDNPELAGLERLCLRSLAREPRDRPESVDSWIAELQAFLDGVRDAEQSRQAADELHQLAGSMFARHQGMRSELARLEEELGDLESVHPSWQPIEEKEALIALSKKRDELHEASWRSFLEAVNCYTDVLVHSPEHASARASLTDIFWSRFLDAERRMEPLEASTYRVLVERYHDGQLERELDGRGSLSVEVEPPGCDLTLHAQWERGLVMTDGPPLVLGRGRLSEPDIAMGSYVLMASAPGRVSVRHPVWVGRGEKVEVAFCLPRAASVPEGHVPVMESEVWIGGDAKAMNSHPLRRVRVGSFAMKRFPVTFGEYCRYLDELRAERSDELEIRLPRTDAEGMICAWDDSLGGHRAFAHLPEEDDYRVRIGENWRRVPVFSVTREDAVAYCRWLGDGYRLPSSLEWELSARGADRRVYPWGNRIDPALAHFQSSLATEPEPGVVDAFPEDCSPYGIRSLAGCIQEWTGSDFDVRRQLCEVRGSGWSVSLVAARSAWRGGASASHRHPFLGFRVVRELES